MATSTAPTIKAALVALLAADGGLTGVPVTYGPPERGELAGTEYVWVGRILHVQAAAALGRQRRSDAYTIEVTCDVRGADRSPQRTLTERAYTLAGIVETAVRTYDPWVAAAGAILVEVTSMELEEGFTDGAQRASRVVVTLSVTSRI